MSSYPGGLGQQPHFDVRNLEHLISDRVADGGGASARLAIVASRAADPADAHTTAKALSAVGAREFQYFYDAAWWGDQGNTSRCTAFGALHGMADGPVTHPGKNPLVDPDTLYAEIRGIDQAEGRYYSDGATSLAMAKALQRRSYIGEYLWGYTLADFVAAIRVGPVLLGLDWYEGMDWPDRKAGIVRAVGSIRGGHEILANGADFKNGLVRLKQSWGRSWGKKGHCYLPFEDLEALIADGGDVCMFRELKVAA